MVVWCTRTRVSLARLESVFRLSPRIQNLPCGCVLNKGDGATIHIKVIPAEFEIMSCMAIVIAALCVTSYQSQAELDYTVKVVKTCCFPGVCGWHHSWTTRSQKWYKIHVLTNKSRTEMGSASRRTAENACSSKSEIISLERYPFRVVVLFNCNTSRSILVQVYVRRWCTTVAASPALGRFGNWFSTRNDKVHGKYWGNWWAVWRTLDKKKYYVCIDSTKLGSWSSSTTAGRIHQLLLSLSFLRKIEFTLSVLKCCQSGRFPWCCWAARSGQNQDSSVETSRIGSFGGTSAPLGLSRCQKSTVCNGLRNADRCFLD